MRHSIFNTKITIIGQSHDFWRAYSLFVARVASFAPERSEGANDAITTYRFNFCMCPD